MIVNITQANSEFPLAPLSHFFRFECGDDLYQIRCTDTEVEDIEDLNLWILDGGEGEEEWNDSASEEWSDGSNDDGDGNSEGRNNSSDDERRPMRMMVWLRMREGRSENKLTKSVYSLPDSPFSGQSHPSFISIL
jgi:hypothetical protein